MFAHFLRSFRSNFNHVGKQYLRLFVPQYVRNYVELVQTSSKLECVCVWWEQEVMIGFNTGFAHE